MAGLLLARLRNPGRLAPGASCTFWRALLGPTGARCDVDLGLSGPWRTRSISTGFRRLGRIPGGAGHAEAPARESAPSLPSGVHEAQQRQRTSGGAVSPLALNRGALAAPSGAPPAPIQTRSGPQRKDPKQDPKRWAQRPRWECRSRTLPAPSESSGASQAKQGQHATRRCSEPSGAQPRRPRCALGRPARPKPDGLHRATQRQHVP
jgi:hypothetical protein